MKRHLKLLITSQCNLKCKYCCNRLPEVKEAIKFNRLCDIDFKKYESINITGGEPLLEVEKLRDILTHIRKTCPSTPIYVYTNGTYLKPYVIEDLLKYRITGFTVSYHPDGPFKNNKRDLLDTVECLRQFLYQVRISVNSKYEKELKYCGLDDVDKLVWEEDKCSNSLLTHEVFII